MKTILITGAAEGRGLSYPMGAPTKLWYWLDRLLPDALRHRLTRYLTGQ